MGRPDPIEYAERLYGAIRAANFSPLSFLAFGNSVKDGVAIRNMPRIAAEPFMRVVGEMLNLEEEAGSSEIVDATISEPIESESAPALAPDVSAAELNAGDAGEVATVPAGGKRRSKR
jgi:hypothetical protein